MGPTIAGRKRQQRWLQLQLQHGDNTPEELVKELGVGLEVPLVFVAVLVYLVSGAFDCLVIGCVVYLGCVDWSIHSINGIDTTTTTATAAIMHGTTTTTQKINKQATYWSARRSGAAGASRSSARASSRSSWVSQFCGCVYVYLSIDPLTDESVGRLYQSISQADRPTCDGVVGWGQESK